MSEEREDYLVPDEPEQSADEQRAAVREQLADAARGAEAEEDPELGIGMPGGGAERVRGYE
jgi:hypothetical protein